MIRVKECVMPETFNALFRENISLGIVLSEFLSRWKYEMLASPVDTPPFLSFHLETNPTCAETESTFKGVQTFLSANSSRESAMKGERI